MFCFPVSRLSNPQPTLAVASSGQPRGIERFLRIVHFQEANVPPIVFNVPLTRTEELEFDQNDQFQSMTRYPESPVSMYHPIAHHFVPIPEKSKLKVDPITHLWIITCNSLLSITECAHVLEHVNRLITRRAYLATSAPPNIVLVNPAILAAMEVENNEDENITDEEFIEIMSGEDSDADYVDHASGDGTDTDVSTEVGSDGSDSELARETEDERGEDADTERKEKEEVEMLVEADVIEVGDARVNVKQDGPESSRSIIDLTREDSGLMINLPISGWEDLDDEEIEVVKVVFDLTHD